MQLFDEIFQTYLSIAPYLFLGLVFAGFLHVIFKKDFVARHLGNNNFFSVIKAAILGVPLPLCSCGVIPTAMFLRKQKASKGATMSFLISTPQTGVDSIIATYGMMGPIFAIFRPIAAFITGILGGLITNIFDRKEQRFELKSIETSHASCSGSCSTESESAEEADSSYFQKISKGLNYAFVEFLDDITWQLLVGVILAGLISFLIPDNFFVNYGGEGWVGMLIMIAVGIPLYVCATSSIPIAVSLILKGISPGAAFVFLVVGPATNAATIALIANTLGKKLMLIYLTVISIFAILSGYLLNYIFDIFGDPQLMLSQHEVGESPLLLGATIIFSFLLLGSIYRKVLRRFGQKSQTQSTTGKVFTIEGMTCNHCVKHVKSAISEVSGVDSVQINLEKELAIVEGSFDATVLKKAVQKAGYKVV
ncbi:MAG: SO_0444 family Cu/Zn efflux transporter [Candidatus Cloacimonadales bacterium]